MARIDPARYPDRLAFEAHARQLQAQEMDRLCGAALEWIESHGRDALRQARQSIAHLGPQARRQIPH